MNPYAPPQLPRRLSRQEYRQAIIDSPYAGPLAKWAAKHPIKAKIAVVLFLLGWLGLVLYIGLSFPR